MDNSKLKFATSSLFIVGLFVFLGLVPIGLYVGMLGSAPQIQAAKALEMLAESSGLVSLVDIRSEKGYQEKHIAGSFSFPLIQIMDLQSAKDLPLTLHDKTLLLVCEAGFQSAQAARYLKSLGVSAFSVRGGMQDWGRAWPQYKDSSFSRFELLDGTMYEPFRALPPWEQAAAALALLWIKPTYMLLSAGLSALLLRQKANDLRLLGWSLLVFLSGEIFCAINYAFLKDNSYFAEYIHSYSMALAFALAIYALVEGLDGRLIHYSRADKHCALLPVCGPCVKYQNIRCGVRRIAQFTCLALIILGIIPLLSPFSYTANNSQIWIANHYYIRPAVHQWFEARYSPSIAILLIGLALLVMQRTPNHALHPLARTLLCTGAGFFGFGMFRVTLGMIYAEALIWATFWEELTELMFISAVIYVLWVFRWKLLPEFNLWSFFDSSFSRRERGSK